MKKAATLLACGLLMAFCTSLAACEQDPSTAKGEEIEQAEWGEAVDEIFNGLSLTDETVSFTLNGEEHYKDSTTVCTIKVNENILYLEESGEKEQYVYAKKADDGEKQYTSSDKSTWKVRTKLSESACTVWENIVLYAPEIKTISRNFNDETSMYEISIKNKYLDGNLNIKVLNKKIAYIEVSSDYVNATYTFTNYGKTSIPISEPEVKLSKLEEVYHMIIEKHGDSTCCKLGSDGSYLTFDKDPLDTGGKEGYGGYGPFIISLYWEILEDVNKSLGLPGYVYQSMQTTTWSQGKQTATANGITVTWTYHPNRGLEAMYIESN